MKKTTQTTETQEVMSEKPSGGKGEGTEKPVVAVQRARVGVNGGPVGPGNPPADACWKPGQTGNPAGRPKNAGATIAEWYNLLAGREEKEIRKIARDKSEPAAKRIAAKSVLRAMRDDFHAAVPKAANDLDRIADRTHGKPTQTVDVTTRRDVQPGEILDTIARTLASRPDLAAMVAAALPDGTMTVTPSKPADGTPEPAQLPTDADNR